MTRQLMSIVKWRSLKTRVTLFTLAIFVISLWSLAFYASRMLREDMARQLGEQQFSTVSLLAAAINEHLSDRVKAVEQVAGRLTPAVLGNHTAAQVFLESRPVFSSLFNGGVFVTRRDGRAIAEAPRSTGRVGLNFMDRDAVAAALQDGKSMIGLPVMGKQPVVPVFGIAAPIHDAQRKVIGAVVGVIALESAGFLDHLTQSRFGKTGGYFLVARKERLIITATNRARIMQPFSAPGVVPAIDRFVEGYEGSAVYTNQFGVEVMNSVKRIAVVDWAISSSIPTAEAFAPIRDMQRRMLMATIILTLLAGVLTWWMLRRQLSPMLAAAVTLARLSVSEQPPQPLPIANQDEIGELISGLNRLLGTLSQREMALKASERKLFTILDGSQVPHAIRFHQRCRADVDRERLLWVQQGWTGNVCLRDGGGVLCLPPGRPVAAGAALRDGFDAIGQSIHRQGNGRGARRFRVDPQARRHRRNLRRRSLAQRDGVRRKYGTAGHLSRHQQAQAYGRTSATVRVFRRTDESAKPPSAQ